MPAPTTQPVRLYRRPWRGVAATLFAVSRLALPFMLWRVIVASDPPVSPPMLAQALLILSVLPGLAAWLIGRAFAARLRLDADGATLVRGGRELRLAADAIGPARVGWLPWPEPAVALRRAGGWLPFVVALRDPGPLLAVLDPTAARHPAAVYAAARGAPPRWWYWLARYVAFPLLPAAVLFRAHQYIAYGGPLGQYYLLGLEPYLRSAAIHWGTTAAYLLLYASAWRGPAEVVAFATACAAPRAARPVRRAVEIVCGLAFWLGVPVVLALRFWA
jgi:hypothetical protein